MEQLKAAGNAVSDKVNEWTASAEKEQHKDTAKDSDESLGERAAAAMKVPGDYIEEKTNEGKYKNDKETALGNN